jgi:hypothetical protein
MLTISQTDLNLSQSWEIDSGILALARALYIVVHDRLDVQVYVARTFDDEFRHLSDLADELMRFIAYKDMRGGLDER